MTRGTGADLGVVSANGGYCSRSRSGSSIPVGFNSAPLRGHSWFMRVARLELVAPSGVPAVRRASGAAWVRPV